ncbi:hypothetical protein N7491_007826 [Penicillium cf. griseofulvum]|nr:hypothetical protein N7491_007826 [Penicillium cf. griseofulvum]
MSTYEKAVWTTIIAPDDVVILQTSGLVNPLLSDCTRRMHKRRLNRSRDEEEQHLSLSSMWLSQSTSSRLPPLSILGTTHKVQLAFGNIEPTGPPENPRESDDIYHGVPFIDVAEGYIYKFLDTCEDDNARWFYCIELYGINSELQ